MSVGVTSGPRTSADPQGRRLESWKEIAAYLGRDITTVRRWEKREGLPVHRLHHSRIGTVYAYTAELDAWRRERAPAPAMGEMAATQPPQTVKSVWKRITLVALGLVLAGGLAWLWRERSVAPSASAISPIRSLAVLPLVNFSGDHDEDYLADGMTEALITELAQVRGLRVISRTSTMQYKGTRKSLPEIARELQVDAIVEGAVAHEDNEIKITAQLIRATTDTHVWAASYSRVQRDVLRLQTEVAEQIARQIGNELNPAERKRSSSAATIDPEAYEAYLKGTYFFDKETPDAIRTGQFWPS
jgi:TolB-like protein